jgi:Na+-transporting NADH:ubiquinone oxidoreductase subunit NqrB
MEIIVIISAIMALALFLYFFFGPIHTVLIRGKEFKPPYPSLEELENMDAIEVEWEPVFDVVLIPHTTIQKEK